MAITTPLGDLALDATLQTLNGIMNAIGALVSTLNAKTTAVDTTHVTVFSMPAVAVTGTVAVSGAYQATQPVSIAAPVAVTGTFWQATQPVSIAAPVAVTGAYQATQPVSIAAPVAVTGTFWQATQPVSGTVAISGSVATTVTSQALPTGASTEITLGQVSTYLSFVSTAAKQDTGNTTLGTISATLTALKSATAATDTNRLATDVRDGFPVSGSAASVTPIMTIDMLNYSMLSTQFTSYGVGTVAVLQSEDQVTWSACYAFVADSISSYINSMTTSKVLVISRKMRYIRLSITAWTSGTFSVVGTLSKHDLYLPPLPSVATTLTGPTNGAMTTPAITTTSSTVLSFNANRKGFLIQNDAASASPILVGMSAVAPTATSYSMSLAPGASYYCPAGNWSGAVNMIVASGTATAHVTDFT